MPRHPIYDEDCEIRRVHRRKTQEIACAIKAHHRLPVDRVRRQHWLRRRNRLAGMVAVARLVQPLAYVPVRVRDHPLVRSKPELK